MQIIFSRRHSLSSLLIRALTWSRWSHVSIVEDRDTVIDARLIGGVARRSLEDLLRESSAVEWRAVPVADEAAALAFALAQVGRRYDWTGIVGWPLRGGWAAADAWWCSELAAAAEVAGGLVRFRPEVWRITPGHLWMVA